MAWLWALVMLMTVYPRWTWCNLQPVVIGDGGGGGGGGGGGSSGSSGSSGASGQSRCEEITVPMCRNIGYNRTSMPNEMNHETQEEAGFEVHQYWPLVEIHCSSELKFFLCSMYTPICLDNYHEPLKVCRSVCERARAGCEPIMLEHKFEWPERMNCSKLPWKNETAMCMEPPSTPALDSGPRGGKRPSATLPPKCKPGQKGKNCREYSADWGNRECSCRCKSPLVPVERNSSRFGGGLRVGRVEDCAIPCDGVFSLEQRDFASAWIAMWSGLCFVATLMTLTTSLIDTERFKYPERPIVFLCGCYFLVSVGYLVRVFLGHDQVACQDDMIVYNATGPTPCTLVFLLVYFFGMASSIWWVILTFTWFLAAGFKWSNEAIASYSQYFHLAAWLVPTVKSVLVLLTSAVDGDAVAGVCSVGNQNPDNLRKFVLYPLIVYLIIGFSFLFGGFVSLFRIRSVFKNQGGIGRNKADKLEKLMIRIGIFSVLYTLPASVLIACYFYESASYDDWMESLTCSCDGGERGAGSGAGASASVQLHRAKLQHTYAVVLLKYFAVLVVGITSGMWVWSGKTVSSWRKLWRRLFGTASKSHKPTLINSAHKTRLVKQQYLLPQPAAVPISSLPAAPSSSLLSGPHITPAANLLGGHHLVNAANFHHHMIKQSQQAPLSHV